MNAIKIYKFVNFVIFNYNYKYNKLKNFKKLNKIDIFRLNFKFSVFMII